MTPRSAPWFQLGFRDTLKYYHVYMAEAAQQGREREAKAYLGQNDLFFLLCFVLRRPDLLKPWLFHRCREVQRNPNDMLDLWAREHYKSTIINFGLTILDIINDPELTIAIFSHTKPIAKTFLRQIKSEMEQNEDLPRLWPDVFWANPKNEAPKWSEDGGLIVKRKGNPKEATLEAHGLVDGQPTSRHFRGMVYDDVVTIESVSTPEQITKTTYAFQMSDNLGAEGGWRRYIGTRYHQFDTYRTIMDDKIATPRLHPATKNGKEDGEPVLLSRETLAKKRRNQGPYVFGSQMLLNPTADTAMGFDPRWLEYGDIEYHQAKQLLWRFIIVDPAGSKQRENNDYTSMFVIGHGEDLKYRVLDIVRDRMNLSKRCETLMALHRYWKPHLVAYEEYGMQADREYIEREQKLQLYEFDILPLGGNMPKPMRIRRLVPHFENGFRATDQIDPVTGLAGDGLSKSRIILPTSCLKQDYQGIAHDLVKDFVEQEYTPFPVLKHDDMFDCLARICDLEAMGAIKIPDPPAPEVVNHKIQEGLRRLGNKGGGSWVTA